MRRLIVNADDFGLSPAVNAGIIRAHEDGIVTTTSLMVRQPCAEAAAEYARSHPALGVGLHLDLGEWSFDGKDWVTRYRWADPDDASAVEREVDLQMDRFEAMVGRWPTHLDSHQHVHRREPVRTILAQRAARLAVPLRHETPGIRYEGRFYGHDGPGSSQPARVSVSALVELLTALPSGTTELCCHPATDQDVATDYSFERTLEAETLCDPEVRVTLEREAIALSTFEAVTR